MAAGSDCVVDRNREKERSLPGNRIVGRVFILVARALLKA